MGPMPAARDGQADYENVFDIPEEALGAVAATTKRVSIQPADGVNVSSL